MLNNPPIVDYEPVTRGSSGAGKTEALVDHEFDQNLANAGADLAQSIPIAAVMATKADRVRASLRRSHSVTFIGLFLFTVVLYFRPYEFHPALSFLTNSAFWLAIFTLILYVPTQLGLNKGLSEKLPEVMFIMLVALAAVLSVPFALDQFHAWLSFIEYLKVVVMFVVMVNVVRTEKRLNALILLAFAVSCVSSVAAVNDYSTGHLRVAGIRIEGVIGGLFSNPNDLALHLVTMIPIAVVLFLSSKTLPRKFFYACCAVLFFAGVVATFSRGGFIGLACAIVVLAWKLARRYRVLFGTAGIVLILVFVAVGPGGYKNRLTVGADSSAEARTGEFARSVYLILRHPVVGVGMNNYILYSNTSHASHNSFTQVGSELGIMAMVAYILLLVTPLRRLAAIRNKAGPIEFRARGYYLIVGIETSLICYMVTSFFLSVAYIWYAYYLIGYAVALRRFSEEGELQLVDLKRQQAVRPARTLQQQQMTK